MSRCPNCGYESVTAADLNYARKVATDAGAPRHTGISSNALVNYAFGVCQRTASSWFFPADEGDLAACRRTVLLAHRLGVTLEVVALMAELYYEFRAHVSQRYPAVLDAHWQLGFAIDGGAHWASGVGNP